MLLMLQVHVTVLVLNLLNLEFSPPAIQSPISGIPSPPFPCVYHSYLTQWGFALQKDAWFFSNEFHSRTSQSSKSIAWHYLSSSSLKLALYRTIIWKLILVVRNIFVKNLDDRIKLFVILGPDGWWCCWQSIISGYTHTLPSFPIMNRFQYVPS